MTKMEAINELNDMKDTALEALKDAENDKAQRFYVRMISALNIAVMELSGIETSGIN